MKRSGFSMIELVFVIVILGVLAAVAVPRFVTTRTDAQIAMARSDIATVLKAIPARVFAENLDPTGNAPDGYSSWGYWMLDTGGLDTNRWEVGSSGGITDGLRPLGNVNVNGSSTSSGACGTIIYIDTSTGILYFDPFKIADASGNTSTFCSGLRDSYASGSNRAIPLTTTGSVKF